MEFNEEKYLKYGGALCPYCDSNDLEASPAEWLTADTMFQEISCGGCGKKWSDQYVLTGAEPVE